MDRDTILICAVDIGDPYEDISDIHGIAVDVEDDEWKIVEFSCYDCIWAQRYEHTENFGMFYAKYKGEIQQLASEIGEMLIDKARKMAERLVERHAKMLAEETRRAEERRAAEEAERLEQEKVEMAREASVGDEYDQTKMAELAKVYNATVGNDTKKCVPALCDVKDVANVYREPRGMNVNDITIIVRKPAEEFNREYYITFRPAGISRIM